MSFNENKDKLCFLTELIFSKMNFSQKEISFEKNVQEIEKSVSGPNTSVVEPAVKN